MAKKISLWCESSNLLFKSLKGIGRTLFRTYKTHFGKRDFYSAICHFLLSTYPGRAGASRPTALKVIDPWFWLLAKAKAQRALVMAADKSRQKTHFQENKTRQKHAHNIYS